MKIGPRYGREGVFAEGEKGEERVYYYNLHLREINETVYAFFEAIDKNERRIGVGVLNDNYGSEPNWASHGWGEYYRPEDDK